MSKTQYTKTLWQKEMKNQILCMRPPHNQNSPTMPARLLTHHYFLAHARAVYTNQVHPSSTFDVVLSVCDFREGNTRRRDGYMAHVIVYGRPDEQRWKLLASSEPKATGVEVYESLLEELQFHLSGLMDEFGE